jgi:hypothetical protein
MLTLGVAASAGCAVSNDELASHFRQAAAPRVAFELQCPAKELAIVVLENRADGPYNPNGSKVGVSGCGQRAVYVYANREAGWVLNSDTKTER